jgi:hypothetical protein
MFVEARLLYPITPDSTSVVLEDNGAIDFFDPAGGTAYFTDDYFEYTSISVPTATFLGVSGLAMQHDEGSLCYPQIGYLLTDIVAALEKSPTFDPDGVMTNLLAILDEATKDVASARKHLRSISNPVLAHSAMLEFITKSIGVEFNPGQPEEFQRMLAMFAANALRSRGNLQTFKFLAWLLCGYVLNTTVTNSLVPFTMNDTYGALCISPTEMVEEPATAGLWRFDGVAPTSTVRNELAPTDPLEVIDLQTNLCWTTDSMFSKDSSAELIPGGIPGHSFLLSGLPSSDFSLNKRSRFSVELWFKPPLAGGGPVFPVNILEKSGVFQLMWLDDEDLQVSYTLPDGSTETITAMGVLTRDQWDYIAFRYSPDGVALVVNENLVYRGLAEMPQLEDPGNDWVFGGNSTGNDALGRYDMFRLSFGWKYESEFLTYYEHIRKLRTVGSDLDEYTYFYTTSCDDGLVDMEIANDDGSPKNHSLLRYLCDEYLEAGDVNIRYVGHYIAECMLGLF